MASVVYPDAALDAAVGEAVMEESPIPNPRSPGARQFRVRSTGYLDAVMASSTTFQVTSPSFDRGSSR